MDKVTDTESFINKSRKVHSGKYTYEKSEYKGSKTKLTITCPLHGDFKQIPNHHLRGVGCFECAKISRSNKRSNDTRHFIEKSVEVHGNKYDYSLSDYKKSSEKIIIVCPIHGEFLQTPNSHMMGSGCKECRKEFLSKKFAMSSEDFIKTALSKRGDFYDYSNVEYTNNHVDVEIICPTHGSFWQSPSNHCNGADCPYCSNGWHTSGYYGSDRPSNLYVFLVGSCFIKVGLSKNVPHREAMVKKQSGLETHTIKCLHGKANELWNLEQKILRKSNLKRFYPEESFAGSTECLELSELPKVLQIIEDWEKNNEESFSETS